jgi:hypothetical protein
MMRALVLVALLASACSKKQESPPPPNDNPRIPESEIKRGEDACKTYVARVCACTTPEAQKQCPLAKALPDAMTTGLEIAMNPETTRRDVVQANDMIRKTMKECIEQAARLPSLGCN